MSDDPRDRLVEAIAWWRAELPDARAILERAAVDLLVSGDDRATVAALASVYADENAFHIDALVERVVDDLDLHDALSIDPRIVATRRICRYVISGDISYRELTRWAHLEFTHESKSDLINELAALDDEYDEIAWTKTTIESLDVRVRAVAVRIIGGE